MRPRGSGHGRRATRESRRVAGGYEHEGAAADDPNGDAWTGGEKGKGFLRTGHLACLRQQLCIEVTWAISRLGCKRRKGCCCV